MPTHQDEEAFLDAQIDLRKSGAGRLNEAMLVLDIIDTKTQSLLGYVSISLAALVFLLSGVTGEASLQVPLLSPRTVKLVLLGNIVAVSLAVPVCLSCLNIVGAHTIRRVGRDRQAYENLIVRVALGRRNRYLWAHRLSMASAICLLLLFGGLLAHELPGPQSAPVALPTQVRE